MSVGVTLRAKKLKKYLRDMDRAPALVKKTLVKHLHWATPFMHRKIIEQASGPAVRVRSGRYRSSIRFSIDDANFTGRVGTKSKYARQIEFGGTITAKGDGWLTIPTDFAKTKAGVSRRARTYHETFFATSKKGNLILFGKRTAGSKKVLPLFVLKKSVDQEGKEVFTTAFKRNHERITKRAEKMLNGALKRLFPD